MNKGIKPDRGELGPEQQSKRIKLTRSEPLHRRPSGAHDPFHGDVEIGGSVHQEH